MTVGDEPQELHSIGQSDTGGYRLFLNVPSNGANADGSAKNTAEAKLTLGGLLQQKQPITFKITKGTAVFSNGLQQIDGQTTDIMGRVDVTFTDTTAEEGEMIAWMTSDADIKSNVAPYLFAAAPHYDLALGSMTPDGESADGKSENEGRAVVTYGGGTLEQAQIVKFEFESGGATFDTTKPYVQPGSNGHTLYVRTHRDGGQDIADAYFTDTEAEAITLVASLVDHPEVDPKTKGFKFYVPLPPPPPPRYSVEITNYPSSVDDESSAPVSGTVVDTKTGDSVTGRCAIGYGSYLNGPDHADAVNGSFGFSIYGAYLSRGFESSSLTVTYEDGSDRVNIAVVPPFKK